MVGVLIHSLQLDSADEGKSFFLFKHNCHFAGPFCSGQPFLFPGICGLHSENGSQCRRESRIPTCASGTIPRLMNRDRTSSEQKLLDILAPSPETGMGRPASLCLKTCTCILSVWEAVLSALYFPVQSRIHVCNYHVTKPLGNAEKQLTSSVSMHIYLHFLNTGFSSWHTVFCQTCLKLFLEATTKTLKCQMFQKKIVVS